MYWGVELNHFISFLGTHTLFQCWQVLLLCWGKEQQPEDDDSGGDLETQAHTSCQRCKTHVRWAESRDLNQIFGACNRYRRVLWRTLRRWTEDDQQKCFWLFLSSWAKREIIYTSPTSQGLHCIRLAPRYLSFGTERAARTSWGTRNGCNRVFKDPGDDPCANFRKGRFSFGNFGACRYVPVSNQSSSWRKLTMCGDTEGATSSMTHYKGISAENANFVSKDTGNMTPSVKLTTQAGH